ncbi:MAG: glycosyltransferase family 4 protein [Sphaerochaeta sp.]|nr:glycosyltransferase family 4 protein [Sphaerochaeta sp.]
MKILFINTTGGYFGGVEQNIALSAKGLTLAGHTCYFACKNTSGIDQRQFDALFVQSWILGKTSLSEIVQTIQPDVFYVHKFESIGDILSVKGSKRVVRMIHDHDLYCPRRHKYYAFTRKICTHRCGLICYADLAFLERSEKGIRFVSIRKKLLEMQSNKNVDAFLVGSAYMQKELVRNGFDHRKIHVLPPCVQSYPQTLQSLPLQPSILFVGQLIKGKGVDILLEAYALLLQKTGFSIPLHLIGQGNEEQALKAQVEDAPYKALVQFHGWVAHEDLSRFYDNCTMVVVPSRWPEPFGMVGVEAMLRQRPVIGADVGGIPDWLKDGQNGFLVPPNDSKALCDAMYSLVSDPQKAKSMGEIGKSKAEELFSYENYMHDLESLLEKKV